MPIKTKSEKVSQTHVVQTTNSTHYYTNISYYNEHSTESKAGKVVYTRKPINNPSPDHTDYIIFYKNSGIHQKFFLKDNPNIELPDAGHVCTNLKKMTDDIMKALSQGQEGAETKDSFIKKIKSLLDREHIIHIDHVKFVEPTSESCIELLEQRYQYRPFLEALFFENISDFTKLVYEINKQGIPASLHTDFINILKNTDLASLVETQFIEKNRTDLLSEIAELERYAKTLSQQTDSEAKKRADQINGIVAALRTDIDDHKKEPSSGDNASTPLATLQFKMSILEKLHQHDKSFTAHRGWKRFFANVASILLTGGLANVGLYFITGHTLFYNKNTTQTKIENIQKKLGLDTHETIQPSQ